MLAIARCRKGTGAHAADAARAEGAALTMMAETKKDVAVVILAGGTGRMKADRPKQFYL